MSNLTPPEIAVEVHMLREIWNGPVMLVEGSTDAKLFSAFYPYEMVRIIPSFGWEGVLEAIDILCKEGVKGIIGIIDQDFRSILEELPDNPNVFITDSHDLETMMIESGAFARVFNEKGSTKKIANWPDGIEGIKIQTYSVAKNIAALRFFNAKNGLLFSFKKMNYKKFVDEHKIQFKAKAFIQHLSRKWPSNASLSIEILTEAIRISLEIDAFTDSSVFCCGHDVTEILALGLRSAWGTHNSTEMTSTIVETILRAAYTEQEFMSSNLAYQIQKWFSENAKN